MLYWFIRECFFYWEQSAEAAVKAGHLAVLRFLFGKRDANDSIERLGYEAAAGGSVEAAKSVYEHPMDHDAILLIQMFEGAVVAGNLEMVKWLHEAHGVMVGTQDVADLSILHGHQPVLEYILQFRTYPAVWAIEMAARNNRMDILQWLHAKISEPNSPLRGTDQGLDRWPVTTDVWIFPEYSRHSLPIDSAAYNGNLEMILWLDANGYGDCSKKAIDSAAANDHLDVVQWLHEHRTEGCTANAMEQAARFGHLDVVRWLHEHRSEGCSVNTFNLADRNGHARVVEFLLQHRSDDCTDTAVQNAARWCQYVEVLDVLYIHRRELVDLEVCER